jgi:DtxR family transcriptional regulator, Mn-dependent transcriptional regulator
MIGPTMMLMLFLMAVLFVLILFLPGRGVVPRWRKLKSQTERVLVEDALKHLYDCEYNTVDCSLNSIIGNLSLTSSDGTKLISRLEELGLVEFTDNKLKLTSNGRSYALKIIRVHRLWELYLANNTSVKETEWHSIAEEREHQTNEKDAKTLSAKLGNPLRDPHGDPIPSESGEMPAQKGIQLGNLAEGEFATIIHIEDEPKEIFAQLFALGLYPGTKIRLLENTKEKIRLEANGDECVLAPVLALNITVAKNIEKEEISESFQSLSSMNLGEEAVVAGLSMALRGQQRRRMLDFGIVPGTKIRAQLRSLGGDPTAYEIRGTTVALRKNQSDHIYIKKIPKGN